MLLAMLAFASSACEENFDPNVSADATLDTFTPLCGSDQDCADGLSCSYPSSLVGCGAKGECRSFDVDADLCTAATTACGCDGKLVQIPACWGGFAPAPVLPTGQKTCGDSG
jgi:hypothetical protein